MALDDFHADDMFHMMEWSSEVWFFIIFIGIVSFISIILILFYIMRKGTNHLESTKSSDQEFKKTELKSNPLLEEAKFCPECGAKFETMDLTYCPACGHKIQ